MGGPWYNRRFKQIGQDLFKYHVTLFVTGPRTPSVELNGLFVLRYKIFSQILEFDSKKFATKIESHSNWEMSWVFLKMSKLLSSCLKRLNQHSKWLPFMMRNFTWFQHYISYFISCSTSLTELGFQTGKWKKDM